MPPELHSASVWALTGRRHVSVIDDDESLRKSVKNLLSSVGMDVAMFASAEAFLQSGTLDETSCLVLDLRLEGMSGLALMAHLSALGKPIPVIMLTAHGDKSVKKRSLAAGAVAFLTKPFRAKELLDAVNAITGPDSSP